MVECVFEYKTAKLNYVKQGVGDALFLFHGFGQDHTAFNLIISSVSHKYTIYSFDLFFHGKSEWNADEKPLEKKFWELLIEAFCKENAIEIFSLAGFSIGCRFVLASAEAFPERTKEIFLLAPDGIKNNIWYTLATYPVLLRKLFKSMILNPDRFMTLAKTLYTYNIIDQSLLNIASYQMNTEGKRKRVYYSWVVFRHLRFNLKNLAHQLNQRNTPVIIALGKQDKIITTTHLNKFSKHLKNHRIEIMDTGHTWFLRNAELVKLFKNS